MLKHYCLAIIIVCLTLPVFSQIAASNDSLRIITYLEQSKYYLKIDKQKAKSLATKSLQLANINKNLQLLAKSFLAVANAERFTGNINTLISDEINAIAYADNSKNKILLFDCLNAYACDLIALSRFDEALVIINREKNLSEKLYNNLSCKAVLLNTQGYFLLKQQKSMTDVKIALNESLSLANQSEDFYLIAKNKLFLFRAMLFSGMRDSTSNYGFEALNYFKKNNYPEEAANCEIEIANNYRFLADLNKSNEYANDAYILMTAHQNNLGAAAAQSILFQNHYFQQQYAEATAATDLLSYHYKKLNFENGTGIANLYNAALYSAKGEYAKADTLFEKAENIANRLNLPLLKAAIFMFESQHLQAQNKSKEADSIGIKGYAAAQQNMSKELLKNIYSSDSNTKLSKSQALDKRLFNDSDFRVLHGKEALQSLRKENELDNIYKPVLSAFDSGLTSAYSKQLVEIETKYKTKLKDDSLRIANQNILLAQSTVKKQSTLLVAAALLAVLLGGGFLLQYKNRQRAERDKAKIELLQNEIHHRVKNNLGIIKRFVEVARRSGRESLSLESLQSRITAIELLHKNLYQSDKAGEISLQTYLEQLVQVISSTFYEEDKDIQIHVNTPVTTNMQTAEKLGLIINELVTNSFKYGFKGRADGEINITAKEVHHDKFTLQVAENGNGYNKEKTARGYGSKLIEGIAHELNAAFSMNTANGVSFTITI